MKLFPMRDAYAKQDRAAVTNNASTLIHSSAFQIWDTMEMYVYAQTTKDAVMDNAMTKVFSPAFLQITSLESIASANWVFKTTATSTMTLTIRHATTTLLRQSAAMEL